MERSKNRKPKVDFIVYMKITKMNQIIIAFDGSVRAGKTSLIANLSRIFGAPSIEEYKKYAMKAGAEFPEFPPKSYEEALRASQFFIDLEKHRCADLKKFDESKIVFVDRTSLSCVAFDYAANRFTGLDTLEEVQELWESAEKIVPDLLFFMDVSQANIKKRMRINNDNFPPHIYDKVFTDDLKFFFEKECSENECVVRIDANQSKEAVESDVKDAIITYMAENS